MRALLAAGAVVATALAASPHTHVSVSPRSGSPESVFRIAFVAPQRTGANGRYYELSATAHRPRAGCIPSLNIRVPDTSPGVRVHLALHPERLGGRWCIGVYHGHITALEGPVCPTGQVCPTFVIKGGTVAHFSLRVK